jgi:uncharacterized membrane protein
MPGEARIPSETERSARESIEEVVALEQQALRERKPGERISDSLTGFIGRLSFVIAHVVLLLAWFVVNSGLVPGVRPFDPFPFGVLTLIVSTEGVLFTLLVLISQNRMSRQADLRAHLTLQVGLLAEKEATRTREILESAARAHGARGSRRAGQEAGHAHGRADARARAEGEAAR